MADIVISIGTKVTEYLVGPILDRARYLFCFNQFKGEFNEAKIELNKRLEEVNEHKGQVTRKSEEITLPVKNWLDNVRNIMDQVLIVIRRNRLTPKDTTITSHLPVDLPRLMYLNLEQPQKSLLTYKATM